MLPLPRYCRRSCEEDLEPTWVFIMVVTALFVLGLRVLCGTVEWKIGESSPAERPVILVVTCQSMRVMESQGQGRRSPPREEIVKKTCCSEAAGTWNTRWLIGWSSRAFPKKFLCPQQEHSVAGQERDCVDDRGCYRRREWDKPAKGTLPPFVKGALVKGLRRERSFRKLRRRRRSQHVRESFMSSSVEARLRGFANTLGAQPRQPFRIGRWVVLRVVERGSQRC